jgi:phage major head subunit gpT-like protein
MQESLDQPGIDTTAVEELAAKAETERWPVLMFENQLLKLSRPAPLPRRSSGLASGRVIEAAVCTAGGLHDLEGAFDAGTLEAAHQSFPHGLGLVDLFMLAARQNGYTGHSSKDVRGMLQAAFRADIRATGGGGFSTLSLPGIMTNVANKFLAAGFAAIESTWRAIAVIGSARDFKTITSYSLTGGLVYEKVGPGGEIKHGDLSELAYTNQIATYARMFAVTRTDIINDDLGALSQIPSRLGRGAALKLNDVFWAAFMDNATFFTTLRGNYFDGAESALSIDSLTTAEAMFMDQTDPDGQPVGVMPSILLVPNALFTTANNLMNSTQIVGGTTASLANNPHAGKYQVVRSSYLSNASYTGNSTTAWYLLADPAALGVIEVRFLNGRETPIVESADADFNTLGVQMRGYHDFGVAKQEYRAGVKSKGVV